MSAETIAAVLAAHTHKTGIRDGRTHCSCGWSGEKFEFGRTLHRRHQAEMVAAALEPVIREREMAAWDGGYTAACEDIQLGTGTETANPYDTKEEA